MEDIDRQAKIDMPVYLLANKVDIKGHSVPINICEEIAIKYDVPFFKTSAKENINVKETFHEIAKKQVEILKSQPQERQSFKLKNTSTILTSNRMSVG